MPRQKKIGPQGGTSATAAKQKYNEGAYDRLYPYVGLGKKAVYESAARASGHMSLNSYLETVLDESSTAILGAEEVERLRKKSAEEKSVKLNKNS